VSVITQDRPASLARLLRSLAAAHYLGDDVELSVSIDSGADGDTLALAANFTWAHGRKRVRRRVLRAGLISAVAESWYPDDDDDYGLLLEDDIEVSPLFYSWLKYGHKKTKTETKKTPWNILEPFSSKPFCDGSF
jgi:hypothetical protein